MPTPLDDLPKLGFQGIQFPYEKISISGELRDHTHEFPRVDGGANELLGRRNYMVTIETKFLSSYRDVIWANNWPGDLERLVQLFERGTTAELMLPQMGPMGCYCTKWDRELSAKVRSGESVKLVFKQNELDFSAVKVVLKTSQARVQGLSATMQDYFAPDAPIYEGGKLPVEEQKHIGGLLGDLQTTVKSFTALRDQKDLYSSAYRDKAASIVGLCQDIESAARDLVNDPRQHRAAASIRKLWAAALLASGTPVQSGLPLITYVNIRQRSVSEISLGLYGTTQRGTDILRFNPIDDAYKVPAGMRLRVTDPKAVAA